MEINETCVSKNLDEIVRLQFAKREEWIQEIRVERLQEIAQESSSAPRLASSSAASFPERNECSGTHCNLIKQKKKTVPARSAREIEIEEKMEEKTGWRGQSEIQIEGEQKRSGRLVGAAKTSKKLAE